MTYRADQPPFGQADLSNCERELIHLPGSIQPHGCLLVLHPTDLTVVQATGNVELHLGVPVGELLGRPVSALGGGLGERLRRLAPDGPGDGLRPFRWALPGDGGGREFEGLAHRLPEAGIVVELQPVDAPLRAEDSRGLARRLDRAVDRFFRASTLRSLASAVVEEIKGLTGYDRVMVYQFDPEGHGEVVAEAREAGLEPFLGLNYPASDIPNRARELYLRNRVRVLVDVDYEPSPLVPGPSPLTGDELDMSLCYLRSMSPIHLQYLRNMGVTGTLVASLVRDGRLWGLVACHHYSPKVLPYTERVAVDLLCDVISTRLAVLKGWDRMRAEMQVRALESRLVEATSAGQDWRKVLMEEPQRLMDPVDASGMALLVQDEVRTAGEVPSTGRIRDLADWIVSVSDDPIFQVHSIARARPELADVSPSACGVLAARLSPAGRDLLLWFRPERITRVDWAGDPRKPVEIGDDPEDLSPRRSFAIWTQEVQGTAAHWDEKDVHFARAVSSSLQDVVLQVRTMTFLVARRQLRELEVHLDRAGLPVLLADAEGRVLMANEAFVRLARAPGLVPRTLDELPALFADEARIRERLQQLREAGTPWRGEAALVTREGPDLPVALRLDPVPEGGRSRLGYVLLVTDLREMVESEAARERLHETLEEVEFPALVDPTGQGLGEEFARVAQRILSNAAVAALETPGEGSGDALEEVEAATRRAAELTRLIFAHVLPREFLN